MRRRREWLYKKVERKAHLLAKWLIGLTVGTFGGTKALTLIGYGIRDLLSGAAFDSKNYYDLTKIKCVLLTKHHYRYFRNIKIFP